MHHAAVFRSFTTTDVGGNATGPQLVGLQTIANPWVLGGAPSAFARQSQDFPREYAAAIKRRVMPLVASNSEQIAFPALVPPNMSVIIGGLSPTTGREILPRGEYWAQRRQRPRPLWFMIGGVTMDKSTSAAISGCTIDLFQTSNDLKVATTTSDGSGNYAFWVSDSVTNFYAVAYLPGTPDKAGTTLNTLKGV
jgi:hypothetical protein